MQTNEAAPGQGNTGKLGLAVDDLNPDARQQLNVPADVHGAAIANVRPGSPADDAGLQPGDVVVEVNRKPVASAEQFANAVHATPAGKDILLLVWSKGERQLSRGPPLRRKPERDVSVRASFYRFARSFRMVGTGYCVRPSGAPREGVCTPHNRLTWSSRWSARNSEVHCIMLPEGLK